MRRSLRILGTLLIVAGLATIGWAVAVWRWQDPFTALYTAREQHALAQDLDRRFADARPKLAANRSALAAEARRYRQGSHVGQGIGRIVVPRIGVNMVVVYGTDHESLKKGPGLDQRTFFPGQERLVYIAGHRTTYAAPFSHIDRLARGDEIRIEMPYGTFEYRVTGRRVVSSRDVSVLKTKQFEQVALQACHPRFFASHRLIVYAKLTAATTSNGRPVSLEASA
jgi:sortase A